MSEADAEAFAQGMEAARRGSTAEPYDDGSSPGYVAAWHAGYNAGVDREE